MKPEILDRLVSTEPALEELRLQGKAIPPPRELIAFMVYWDRETRNLKQQALASLAGVSVTSIERIERAEPVTDGTLDKVAVALGRPVGAFTTPQVPLGREEAAKRMVEEFEPFLHKISVPVGPLRKEAQVRQLANTVCGYVDGSEIESQFPTEMAVLKEWTEYISIAKGFDADPNLPGGSPSDRPKPRQTYKAYLEVVRDFEIKTRSVVLMGAYEADTEYPPIPTVKVGVVSAFSKATDPGAIKRSFLFLPSKIDLSDVWKRFISGNEHP